MNEPTRLKLNLGLDYRFVSLALLAIIVAMLAVWRPWSATAGSNGRTIEVTGQSTVSARPDEFVFYPSYEFSNGDKAAALEQMAAKSTEITAGLKKLGVADNDIKTNSDSWSYPATLKSGGGSTATYTLRLTVTTRTDELTQKVQDYLVSTAPTGSISPQATFSESKLKEVEAKGRDEAGKDARAKAEQSAKNLGFKVASVKSVSDSAGFGSAYPLMERAVAPDSSSSSDSLAVQPGENKITYSVTVVYYIK